MISDEKLLSVAIEYYIKRRTQKEIAKDMSVSHVQVGKYLKEAQRRNIVSITVNIPLSKDKEDDMKTLFREIFGLKNLVLVQGSDNSDKSHDRVVGKASSYILETYPNTYTRVGYGWGKTMYDIANCTSLVGNKTDWEFCPLCVIAKNTGNAYFDSISITRKLAVKCGAKVDEKLVERLILSQKISSEVFIEDCRKRWKDINVMICGLGCSSSRYPIPRQDMFSKQVFDEINMKNLVGDILHNFYDIDGRIYDGTEHDLIIPLEEIKSIPHVIAVASGFPKVESIIGGLRTGLVDTLITDVQTAQHVIDYFK
jgi:DNA-binding transcriptional regulator LsrR (DeoR family)